MWPSSNDTGNDSDQVVYHKETFTAATVSHNDGENMFTLESMKGELKEITRAVSSTPETTTGRSSTCSTVSSTGHIGNLSFEQSKKLFHLWGMLLEYLQRPYDQKVLLVSPLPCQPLTKKNRRQLAQSPPY